ncbi:MAG: hypothetical protein IIC66_06965, partial [candidate division Zixibacteria bacterium]|nr:hypothetical protein [candidate division Zixibacteria bacterium]
MKKRYFFVIFLTYILTIPLSADIESAQKPSEKKDINPRIRQIIDYALPKLG